MVMMATSKKILAAMRGSPKNVRFSDLFRICIEHFGEPRQRSTSHAVFKPLGPAIRVSTFKRKEGKPRLIRFARF